MLLAFAYRDGLAADPRRPNVGAGHGLAGWAGAVLDEVPYPMLLLAADLRVRCANRAAQRRFDHAAPWQLQGGRLHAPNARETQQIAAAVHAACAHGRRTLLPTSEACARPSVAVTPVLAPDAEPCALLTFAKSRSCEPLSLFWFARQHGLTDAEARVLRALSDGEAPLDIARRHGVGLATVRSQIGKLRAKTGTHDIGALVRMVSLLPPLLERQAA